LTLTHPQAVCDCCLPPCFSADLSLTLSHP
jgi:hypothetical protein